MTVKQLEDMKIGTEYSNKPKLMAEQRVFALSGGPFNSPNFPAKNIHTSLEFAKSVGLPTRAISAAQYEGQLTALLVEILDDDWFKHGRMEVKFIATVDVGDVITSKAVVSSIEKQKEGTRIFFNVWCENQHGNKVLIGTASCLISK